MAIRNETTASEDRARITSLSSVVTTSEVVESRDIRKADFEDDDFDISFTDSTCPINAIVSQVREPGFDYILALNDPRRINSLLGKRWVFVDPTLQSSRPTFNIEEKLKDVITVGDTILMKRDSRYGAKEELRGIEKNRSVMASSLSGFKRSSSPITQITSLENPFGN